MARTAVLYSAQPEMKAGMTGAEGTRVGLESTTFAVVSSPDVGLVSALLCEGSSLALSTLICRANASESASNVAIAARSNLACSDAMTPRYFEAKGTVTRVKKRGCVARVVGEESRSSVSVERHGVAQVRLPCVLHKEVVSAFGV